jgi:hypothetical protein
VHLPAEAPWLAGWLEELLAFPSGRHDDQVDSTSQSLDVLSARTPPLQRGREGWVRPPYRLRPAGVVRPQRPYRPSPGPMDTCQRDLTWMTGPLAGTAKRPSDEIQEGSKEPLASRGSELSMTRELWPRGPSVQRPVLCPVCALAGHVRDERELWAPW